MNHKLSVIVPVYNEEGTIQEILERIFDAPLSIPKEVIVVDDGSTDASAELINKFIKSHNADIKYLRKENGGKGSAVKLGFHHATGDVCIIQDADLEYTPKDFQSCIDPILRGEYQIVYGSRNLHPENKAHSSWIFYLGGRLVTAATNLLYKSQLTDEATCYKTFATETLRRFRIDSDGFEWEPEITAKLLKAGVKIGEVPVRYYPRKVAEGKKIGWSDGVRAIWTLLRHRFV